MSIIANLTRDSLARYIKSKCAFKLRITYDGILLKPIYDFEHSTIPDKTYIGIIKQRLDGFWLDVGQVERCNFCADEGAIIYSIAIVNRVNNTYKDKERITISVPSRTIDCIFQVMK